MKWSWGSAVIGALVVLLATGAVLLRNGLSAAAGLTPVEDELFYHIRKTAVAAAAREGNNPYAGDASAWKDAVHHFDHECAFCHGPAGRAQTEISRALYPPAPDLTRAETQKLSDAELHHIIADGIRMTGMPAMPAHEDPEESWKLVALVRKLPELTKGDLEDVVGTSGREPAGR